MSKFPALTPRKVIKVLEKAGFVFKRQKGSHRLYAKGRRQVTIPYHHKDLKTPTVNSIIEQSGLTKEEFLASYR